MMSLGGGQREAKEAMSVGSVRRTRVMSNKL